MRTFLAFCVLSSGCCLPGVGERDEPPVPVQPAIPIAKGHPIPPSPQPSEAPLAPSPPVEPPPPPVSEAELRGREAAAYSESRINPFSQRAMQARARYLSWVDPETGPTGRERQIYGVYTLAGNASRCRDVVTARAAQPPSMPEAERAAADYATALETLIPLLARADTYYERESYRDDGFALGRELHPQLIAALDAMRDADRALRAQVESAEDAARAERIAQLELDPARHGELVRERFMSRAIAFVRLASTVRVESNRYVIDDTPAFVQAALDLERSVNELAEFRGEADRLLQSALGMMRRVRDGTRFTTGERMNLGDAASGWMVDGSFEEVQMHHNRVVDAYNRL
jgi:hypothetical protein